MNWQAIAAGAVIVVTLIGVAIGRYPALNMNRATIALVGATFLVALGALTLEQAYAAVDWNTILLLFGMMVLNVNLRMAGFFHLVTAKVLTVAATPRRLLALLIVISGLFSAVMLFRPIIPTLADPHAAWLTLAMATTLAGNLTLLGSVANLIVAETARSRGVHLSFTEYMRAGTPIAVLSLLLGAAWLAA
ncbi:MAG: SLC13 family permease [Opitutus sp.]